MSNDFNKEEIVAFDKIIEGFEDYLVLSKKVSKYSTDSQGMERSGDIVWRPMPYIARSFDGMDQTANFFDKTQLSVPATLGFEKSSPWIMDAKELRDALQSDRLGKAAAQKLASDINVAIMNVAANQGTLVVPVSTAAGDYDDIALCDSIMNEQGVPQMDRYLALSSRDYNGMAGNLTTLGSNMSSKKPDGAYERGYVGEVAGFSTVKLDYANRIAAAAGGAALTFDNTTATGNDYTPVATSTATTGQRNNVDNRYQTITISSTTSVAAGDCFTIAGIQSVHHITKQATGQLKTFRVISVDSATTMTISPPIISGQNGSQAALEYKNCEVVTESGTAAIAFLNIAASNINPFWHYDAMEILPGKYSVPSDAGTAVMRSTTESGVELVWQKWYDINTMKIKYRLDTLFGVVNKQPEMSGILIFNQT